MKTRLLLVVGLVLLVALAPVGAAAQNPRLPGAAPRVASAGDPSLEGTAEIHGVLFDPLGGGAGDLVLVLAGGAHGREYVARTNELGAFRFEKLQAGTYMLAAAVDFVPASRITVGTGETVEHDIHMALDAVTGVLTACRDCPPEPSIAPPESLLKEFQADREAAWKQPVMGAEPAGGWEYFRPNFMDHLEPQDGHTGTVVVEGTIGTDGFVANLRVASAAHPALGTAALAALKDLPWTPARVRGLAVEVPLRLTIDYVKAPGP